MINTSKVFSSLSMMTPLISFWMLLPTLLVPLSKASFQKQAATATATADVFDAFLSRSEQLSKLSQMFLQHCDDVHSLRVIENLSFHLWIIFTTIASNSFAIRIYDTISHVASPV
jgi:hypothetical protein